MGRHAGTRHLVFFVAASLGAVDVLDVQRVPLHGDPRVAVVQVEVPANPVEVRCDVLVAGAGMGGIGAALAVARRGHSVCLTEETDWVGGQATSGGVSALDENRFIEFAGGTRSYQEFRRGIRDWYRKQGHLTAQAAEWENLNPGACYVSPLCFEPRVGVQVLDRMLSGPRIQVFRRTAVFALDRQAHRIDSALAWRFEERKVVRFRIRFVLDATEMGDLLPLAKVPYVVGAESQSDTAEPDAPAQGNPACVQSFTYPFVVERAARVGTPIEKPAGYDAILKRQGFSLKANYPVEFGWRGDFEYRMFGDEPPIPNNMSPGPMFPWRRLLDHRNFASGVPNDIALMNWPRQDYGVESPLDREPVELAGILQRAKQTSEAFLYWLQHDYPELKLRADVMGTADGISKYPYVRESRRMVARGRVAEQDIIDELQTGARAKWFGDSVGTGFYMVDIHPCGANEHGRMRMPKPFQIPLATLLTREAVNFLPAGKNLGVTHLTNGAFRLHPVEWNVGEAAGTVASLWIEGGGEPQAGAVQTELAKAGVPMVWFDDVASDHAAFAAIQIAALRGAYPIELGSLHAAPDAPVTRAEAAVALAAYFGEKGDAKNALAYAVSHGWMAADHRNWLHADLPFYWTDWREDKLQGKLPALHAKRTGPVKRWEMALRFYGD